MLYAIVSDMLSERELRRREKVLHTMIHLYCRARHMGSEKLCPSCSDLFSYAAEKMRTCPSLDRGMFCSSCEVHCYGEKEREQIREIMRYSGPRMMLHHPLMALSHLLHTLPQRKNR